MIKVGSKVKVTYPLFPEQQDTVFIVDKITPVGNGYKYQCSKGHIYLRRELEVIEWKIHTISSMMQ